MYKRKLASNAGSGGIQAAVSGNALDHPALAAGLQWEEYVTRQMMGVGPEIGDSGELTRRNVKQLSC